MARQLATQLAFRPPDHGVRRNVIAIAPLTMAMAKRALWTFSPPRCRQYPCSLLKNTNFRCRFVALLSYTVKCPNSMMWLAWPTVINSDRIRPFVADRLLRFTSYASVDDAQRLFGRIIKRFTVAGALPSGPGTGDLLDV